MPLFHPLENNLMRENRRKFNLNVLHIFNITLIWDIRDAIIPEGN